MFARISERTIRIVRWALVGGWLLIIASLLFDPFSSRLNDPHAARSPFRLNRAASAPIDRDRYHCPVADQRGAVDWFGLPAGRCDARCPKVQERCLIQQPYAMGARFFWTMILPLVPIFLMVFGHEAWRRICPLSALMQLPRILGLQRRERFIDPRSGKTESRARLVKAGSFLAKNFWFVQFGLLWIGLSSRLLFINSDRASLAFFFLGVIAIAMTVGVLFGGKTWCQYVCPLSPVQKFYTEPRGLFESMAHVGPAAATTGAITQSSCRSVGADGKEQSTCVGCRAPCPDIDLERQYWKDLQTPGRRFFYYGYLGLVLGFYFYYRLYAGNWDYYFTGAWTHDESQLGSLLSPGWFLFGRAIRVPKLLAAPITLALFILGAYACGRLVERGYHSWRENRGRPLQPSELRHRVFALFTFVTFNAFYAFAGRPNLALLPTFWRTMVDGLFVAVSTAWLVRRFLRDVDEYERESIAGSLRRQLVHLRLDTPRLFHGRSLDHLRTDEVYTLGRVLPELTAHQGRSAYRETLRDALGADHATSAAARSVLKVVRQQLRISEEEHGSMLAELGVNDGAALEPEGSTPEERRLRLEGYTSEIEAMLSSSLETGRALAEALSEPAIQARVKSLQSVYSIDEIEHQGVCEALLGREGVLIRRARDMTHNLIRLGGIRAALIGVHGDGEPLAWLLVLSLDRRQEQLATRIAAQLSALGDSEESLSIVQALAQSRSAATSVLRLTGHLHPTLVSALEVPTPAGAERGVPLERALSEIATSWEPAARRIAQALAPGLALVPAGAGGDDPALLRRMGQLGACPLFAHLSLESLERLAVVAISREHEAGEIICARGAANEEVLLIVAGAAQMLIETKGGVARAGVVDAGQTIGELEAITGRPRSATAVADITGASVLGIPLAAFRTLLDHDVRTATAMLHLVSERLSESLGTVVATSGTTWERGEWEPN